MDLLNLIILILLVLILMKISSLSDKLNHLEKLLKTSLTKENKLDVHIKKEVQQVTLPQPRPQQKPKLHAQLQAKRTQALKQSKAPKASSPTIQEYFQKKFAGVSLEELLFGNIILKVAIVAFILGIGLFLKYSIDQNWIPIWGRVLIGIAVGIAMLVAGIKMIDNQYKLFSESLFGGGIAVLYLSIFAAFALEGFMFISANYAFVAMILITLLAGVISIRFDAKSTAIFGLIGGFATPFLLSTGSGNYVGLLSYMLMLNLGILFISIYKKWSLLSWMAFVITAVTQLSTVWLTADDFLPLVLLYGAFFVIYSIVPFINEIKTQEQTLKKPFVFLFWANFGVVILSYLALFEQYQITQHYYAIVTTLLATYLLGYASVLTKKKVLLKNLFYILLAEAVALLLVTPAFIFSGSSLSIVWAVESLMLLWIAIKTKESTYALFSLLGFGIMLARYLSFDLLSNRLNYLGDSLQTLAYVQSLAITSLFVIGSLFSAYKLLEKHPVDFKYTSTKLVQTVLFMGAFIGAYSISTLLSFLLTDVYASNIFSMLYMLIIALFSFLLYKSPYAQMGRAIFYAFIALLMIGFFNNILHITGENILISLVNFMLFMGVVGFIYTLVFKEEKITIANHSLPTLMLGAGVSLLFLFLNVEVYHLVKLYSPTGTKFAITLLWVTFGIALFVYGITKNIKQAKMVGTALILVAILKAFLFDLANLDSIYRILLFLVLGVILFGLSYFYQNNNNKKEEK